jgi:ABC-2 type transport system permease protein
MLDAVRAEALKLRRHRATWLMVWIYPIVITLITLGMLAYGALTPPQAVPPGGAPLPAKWVANSTMFWNFPWSAPGRFLLAGFAAVVFAGEYGWNTWKLIIPARTRWQLIAAKWVIALSFVMIAFVLADLLLLLGSWLQSSQDDGIPAGVTLGAVAQAHLRAAGYALLPLVYTVAFAGMFAILTQSILATVILSIALVVVEQLFPLLALFAYPYAPGLTVLLAKLLPFYHMANLAMWAKVDAALTLPLAPGAVVSLGWGTSFAALASWIATAGTITQLRFLRQDLN